MKKTLATLALSALTYTASQAQNFQSQDGVEGGSGADPVTATTVKQNPAFQDVAALLPRDVDTSLCATTGEFIFNLDHVTRVGALQAGDKLNFSDENHRNLRYNCAAYMPPLKDADAMAGYPISSSKTGIAAVKHLAPCAALVALRDNKTNLVNVVPVTLNTPITISSDQEVFLLSNQMYHTGNQGEMTLTYDVQRSAFITRAP